MTRCDKCGKVRLSSIRPGTLPPGDPCKCELCGNCYGIILSKMPPGTSKPNHPCDCKLD